MSIATQSSSASEDVFLCNAIGCSHIHKVSSNYLILCEPIGLLNCLECLLAACSREACVCCVLVSLIDTLTIRPNFKPGCMCHESNQMQVLTVHVVFLFAHCVCWFLPADSWQQFMCFFFTSPSRDEKWFFESDVFRASRWYRDVEG